MPAKKIGKKQASPPRSLLANGGDGHPPEKRAVRVDPETLPEDQRDLFYLLNRARNHLLTGKAGDANPALIRELRTFLGEKKPAHRPCAEGHKSNVKSAVDHLLALGHKKAAAFRVVADILNRSPEAIKSTYNNKVKNS